MALSEELSRAAELAAPWARGDEELAGVLPAEPAAGGRVYVCAYRRGDEWRWLALDAAGRPVDEAGRPLLDPDGNPLPPAPRTPLCQAVGHIYGFRTWIDGAWYRCCGGHVRKLIDCCAYSRRRINGDAALTGYCYRGRRVFCVHYYDTKVPC
jgi:hypothetical protein